MEGRYNISSHPPNSLCTRMGLAEIIVATIVDKITPVEFDPSPHILLPEDDPRLTVSSLLQWELRNVQLAFEKISDELLAPFKAFLNSAAARDKLARLVQYALLVPMGLLHPRRHIRANCERLREALSDARRTFRWFQGVTPLLALRPTAPVHEERRLDLWGLSVGAHLGMLTYTLLDHRRWLQRLKLVSGEASRSAARAESCLAAMHLCNLVALVRRVGMRPHECERHQERARRLLGHVLLQWLLPALRRLLPETTEQFVPPERRMAIETALSADAPPMPPPIGAERETLRTGARELMCFLQSAHIGKLFRTHDTFVGILGAVTSAMDIHRLLRPASKLD